MAMRDDLTVDVVSSRVRKAFPTRAENRNEHFPPESADGVSEYWQVRQFLAGKDWDAITAQDLQAYQGDEQAILAFLTPKGFCYYLPAFLLIALNVIGHYPALAGAVIFYLTLSHSDDDAKRDIGRYSMFTAQQRDAIRTWLKYVDSQKTGVKSYTLRADVALARYWDRP